VASPTATYLAENGLGKVAIDLDRPRFLMFDWKALETLERVLGRGFLSDDIRASTFNGFTELKVFIWAGLLHDSPELTLKDVEPWLKLNKVAEYSECVTKAVIAAMPEAAKGKVETPPKPGVQ
jgi:hypothetical protein